MTFLATLALSLIFVTAETANGGESITIPLSEIWAWDMPGTKDIHKLDIKKLKVPLGYLQTGPLDMLERLNKIHAEPGFVVVGTGQEALEAAHKQLPRQPKLNDYFLEKPNNQFVEGAELSLVFFSHPVGRLCHLQKIKRGGDTISITYQFFLIESEAIAPHIALIPLGRLPAGEYKVRINIDQIALDKKIELQHPLRGIDTSLSVCRPFMFSVLKVSKKDKTP